MKIILEGLNGKRKVCESGLARRGGFPNNRWPPSLPHRPRSARMEE